VNPAIVMHALSTAPDMQAVFPIRTQSEANKAGHEHWRVTAGRRKAQRAEATLMWRSYLRGAPKPRAVKLTRVAPRDLDSDNLPPSFKALRDGIADAIGCDDSARAGIEWLYDQERGEPKQYAVKVSVWL